VKFFRAFLLSAILAAPLAAFAQEAPPADKPQQEETKKPADPMSAATFADLALRSIGPALTSGRVAAFAVLLAAIGLRAYVRWSRPPATVPPRERH